ncbi:MAG TPA: class I SAM-dependent methyltransferase [Candidatus Dormibacteraeota bacterium]
MTAAPLPRIYRAEAWAGGPARVYDRLAAALLARCPLPLAGALLLDAGAGTGAVSAAAAARGARVLATDVAVDMLRHDRTRRPPATAADVLALPLRDGCVDVAATAFVLNHLADPAAALRELSRVVRPGGAVLAATFAARSDDALKHDVDAVLAAHGYRPPPWYRRMKDELEPPTARPELLARTARRAGLHRPRVEEVEVGMGMLDARALAGFRLGAPAVAGYLDTLDEPRRSRVWAEAERAAEAARPYVARMLVLSSTVAA